MNDDELRRRVKDAVDRVHRPAPGLARRTAEAVERDRARRRLPAVLGWVAVAVVGLGIAAGAVVRHELGRNQGPVTTPGPTPTPQQTLYALTAGNQVVAVDRATLRVRWRRQVGAAPTATMAPAQSMQLSPDGATLYVLPPSEDRGGTTMHLLDAARGTDLGAVTLTPAGGALYRVIVVNPGSGDVYAVGQDQAHILVTVVDPQRRVVLSTVAVHTLPAAARALGPDFPSRAALTADGSRLYYSYGSADARPAGIDWVAVDGATLSPCRPASPTAACIPGAGGAFALAGTHLLFPLAAGGEVEETTLDGVEVRRLATGLHSGGDMVVAGAAVEMVGDCPDVGGLVRVDPASGQVSPLETPGPVGVEPTAQTVCGQTPVLLGAGSIAVSRLTQGRAGTSVAGQVDVVDLGTGRVLRSLTLPADATDLLAP